MIRFNLTIDLDELDNYSDAGKLLRDIAKILLVRSEDLTLQSVVGSISEYKLSVKTEGDINKARFLMSKLKAAKLAPIKKVKLRHAGRGAVNG